MIDGRSLRLERLTGVMRAIADQTEMQLVLQTVISAAAELTESEAASILELEGPNGSLCFLAAPPAFQDKLHGVRIPINASAAGWVVRQRQTLRVADVRKGAPDDWSSAEFAAAVEPRSLLAVPLIAGGRMIGVLEAVNTDKADYTEEDATILETLAAPAALVIHNTNLQRRIEASFSELSELDRLKSDFVAITSHELRTPLGVILGHATFLRELLDEPYREQLDVIIKNASRLKEIVESLASMDNFKTGGARVRQRAISITRIVQEVVGSFADLAEERNITLKNEPGHTELFVEADETKISIALSNLVKNAITFTDEGGHVLVNSQSMPGYVKVSVTDDGIGIPMKDLPRVFDRFFQVEAHLTRRHNGMGLGLAVAKVMVEMHGGRIWAESVEGRGSTFSFLLPAVAVEAESAAV